MKKFYTKIGELVDSLPDAIPSQIRDLIKNAILGDKDLKQLMDGIDAHRPPKLFLMGRTGVGKSSLINALFGSYVASVSDVKSCTAGTHIYKYPNAENPMMEICDTRGIAESESIDDKISAEDMLINQINEFSPDAALFMLNCTHRDDVDKDVDFLKSLAKSYEKLNGVRLPIIVVINKSDEMAPARKKDPSEYTLSKIEKIQEVVDYYKGIIVNRGLNIDHIVAVSSLIDWQTSDGTEVSVENIENLPQNDIENIQIAFDGRYQIEELVDKLLDVIQDSEARMGLRMSSRLTEVVRRLAVQINKIFSGIAATIALTPIPVSDIYLLLILQAFLVSLIAFLSGREISLDTAKEFILGSAGITGVGYSLKLVAQQSSKFLNGVFPGAGSVVSSGIAAFGTSAIGMAAIYYFIDGKGKTRLKSCLIKKNIEKKL